MNKAQLLEGYKAMLRIRLVEERLVSLYLQRNIRSFAHFYIGQEAIAVGVCMNLQLRDYAFGTHRCHGHYLAKGGSLKGMVAELFGKETGCAHGRGGSMHLIDKAVGYMGSVSILASVVPIAAGAAFSATNAGNGGVSVVFVGDGAADEGSFYETVNLAALMKLPIVFVLEDNLYAAMSDKEARHPKTFDMGTVVKGLGGILYWVDGNDVKHVYGAMKHGLKAMERTKKPIVLMCATYRHMAHSAPIFDDKLGYRKEDDKKTRLAACPLLQAKNDLLIAGVQQGIFGVLETAIHKEIDEAIAFADQSPMPDYMQLTDGVYYE